MKPIEVEICGLPTIVAGPEYHWINTIANMSKLDFLRLRAKHAEKQDHPVYLAHWHRLANEIEERERANSEHSI